MRLCRNDRAEMLPDIHTCGKSQSVTETVCNVCDNDDADVCHRAGTVILFDQATNGQCRFLCGQKLELMASTIRGNGPACVSIPGQHANSPLDGR